MYTIKFSANPTDSPRRVSQMDWIGASAAFTEEGIHQRSQWSISREEPTVIVHLDGRMNELDSRIDGGLRNLNPATKGDVWIIPADREYRAEAIGSRIRYAELRVQTSAFSGLTGYLSQLSPRQGVRDDFIHATANQLASHALWPVGMVARMTGDAIVAALVHHLAVTYGDARERSVPASGGLSPAQKRRTEEFVHEALSNEISLATLAEMNGLTVHQLLKAFRESFGVTPAQYVIEQRLRRARWFLANSNQKIGVIALECGFSGPSHLSMHFKSRLGLTPQEFRRSAFESR